jgi:hypothetical protein
MTEEQKSLVGDVTLVEKAPHNLEVGEGTYPQQGGKFRGVSIGRSDSGYFPFTHRTRSNKSYNDPSDIPDNVITFVRSTG